MSNFIDLGSTPASERCAQLGSDGYHERARSECRTFIDLIRRIVGEEPPSVHLAVKSNDHRSGVPLSVVCYFDPESPEAADYVYWCVTECPEHWDEQARLELTKGGVAL